MNDTLKLEIGNKVCFEDNANTYADTYYTNERSRERSGLISIFVLNNIEWPNGHKSKKMMFEFTDAGMREKFMTACCQEFNMISNNDNKLEISFDGSAERDAAKFVASVFAYYHIDVDSVDRIIHGFSVTVLDMMMQHVEMEQFTYAFTNAMLSTHSRRPGPNFHLDTPSGTESYADNLRHSFNLSEDYMFCLGLACLINNKPSEAKQCFSNIPNYYPHANAAKTLMNISVDSPQAAKKVDVSFNSMKFSLDPNLDPRFYYLSIMKNLGEQKDSSSTNAAPEPTQPRKLG